MKLQRNFRKWAISLDTELITLRSKCFRYYSPVVHTNRNRLKKKLSWWWFL
jgi:hypothetical protein